jgi:hypothetical protein
MSLKVDNTRQRPISARVWSGLMNASSSSSGQDKTYMENKVLPKHNG